MSQTLTRFGASLSGPLICMAALFGAGVGYLRYQGERQGLEPLEPSPAESLPAESPLAPTPADSPLDTPLDSPVPTPASSPLVSPSPAGGPASRVGAQRALDAGEFAEAIRQAEVVRADELAAEAALLQALTRSIPPSEFARVEVVTEVSLASGSTLLGIVSEAGDRLLVVQIDGRERRLAPGEIKSRRELRGGDRLAALRSQLAAARADLGSGAGGLALHRLAYLAFSADIRPLGTKILREALQGRDGAILVDMFGEGDFTQLHRTRRALAGQPEPEPIARRDPPPTQTPTPSRARRPSRCGATCVPASDTSAPRAPTG